MHERALRVGTTQRHLNHSEFPSESQQTLTKMPRLHTPFSNPFAHASHTLTPYSRQRDTMSPAISDKENEPPASPPEKILASQAALRDKLREQPNTQYYDPFQPREKVRDMMQSYRRLIQETTGICRHGCNFC